MRLFRHRTHLLAVGLALLNVLVVRAELTDAWPLVVRADQAATITMAFANEPMLATGEGLVLQYACSDGRRSDGTLLAWGTYEEVPFTRQGDTLVATVHCRGETAHTLRLVSPHEKTGMEKPRVHGVANLYSLKPDVFALRPYKGDVHMHSRFSDGRKDETPSHMVATCRKLGCDFAIVTDHRSYAGSQEAMATLAGLPTDMRCFPGEEVHSPGNGVHILALGASAGLTEWFTDHRPDYDAAVAVEKARISPAELPEDLHYQAAASAVVWDRIRALGGIAVFCHPYWRPEHRQYIPAELSDYLLKQARFDAFEVLNGGSSELSILHYHDLRAQGLAVAGIGVTDAHASANLGKAYTLVLAESLDIAALAASMSMAAT